MIQITPHMRVLVAIQPVDFRSGIDGLSRVLVYDGQGFWLCQKRMSSNRFRFWPSATDVAVSPLLAHEFQVLIFGGDPSRAQAAPMWRKIDPETVLRPPS